MKSRIVLERMTFFARHGCYEAERITGNTFFVDLSVDYDISRAAESDEVADTLDYSKLFDVVKAQMQIPSNLLENVAGRIVRALSEEFPQITGGMLSVAKQAPAMGGQLQASKVVIEW